MRGLCHLQYRHPVWLKFKKYVVSGKCAVLGWAAKLSKLNCEVENYFVKFAKLKIAEIYKIKHNCEMQTVSSEVLRNQEQKFRKMCKVKLDVQQIKSGKENFPFHEI